MTPLKGIKMRITINEKEYESGKITREKYRSFCETFDSFLKKDANSMVFTDEDLDKMIESIVVVYGNQFTFDEASDALDEIPDILLNFSLINAEILNKSNLQAEKTAKTGKANIITIGGKEYDCGKIGRKKYKAFREVYERLTRPEKQTYTDTELDEMINTIVLVYDNQFTFEEANESLEDVSEIIFNFGLINANILKKFKDEAAGAKKNLSSQV